MLDCQANWMVSKMFGLMKKIASHGYVHDDVKCMSYLDHCRVVKYYENALGKKDQAIAALKQITSVQSDMIDIKDKVIESYELEIEIARDIIRQANK